MTDHRGPDPEPARRPDCGGPVDEPDESHCQLCRDLRWAAELQRRRRTDRRP